MTKEFQIPEEVLKHPAWFRLQDQMKWYSKESAKNKQRYYQLKICQIILASLIPIISLSGYPITKLIMALFGAAIAIIEGIQQLLQYHSLWLGYRSTNEQLKHEQYLFLSLSGPYRNLNYEEGLLLLAERIEEHISKEHAKWVNTTNKVSEKRN
ncbi:hypothetical protein DSCO28_10360 [Desulfosarcina ovata subsp. sediminis]|uniref:DUF4231 domain-containing protein n=3 Tax=Desulfosarcina ovata TaxID=83564 RepID=A0A5K8A7U0_9BACT|nr:hypothetical protein DSCO28_10360 [Desulfosarcina ovata subsp. sediminis]BBO88424.1 hypothetical protein DSCOOX_16040 [Desulfosarcina ovata subsp. ovata]